MKELTPKQQRFCDEYLIDLNATRAALRAGYSSATALSGQLMAFPKIKAYIAERTEAITNKIQLTQDMVTTELARVAFANLGDYFGDDGKIKPMNELNKVATAALWNVKVVEKGGETTVTIRMHNKMAALSKLANLLADAPAPQPEVKYVYIDREAMDAYDKFEDTSFDEPKKVEEVEEDNEEEEDDDNNTNQQEDAEARQAREKEIRVAAVREQELRCRREFEHELAAIRQHYADEEEKRLAEEAKKIGVPSRRYLEMMKG
jgi:hypothetical protein